MSIRELIIAIPVLVGTVAYLEWLSANSSAVSPVHLAYAILVNFTFLAVATALVTALELPLFPATYFSSKRFEKDGRIYGWTGIEVFIPCLRFIGWERSWRRSIPVKNDLSSLRKYSDSTRGAEVIHTFAAALTVLFTLTTAARHSLAETGWLWGFNTLLNVYPVMLQRHNRPRVDRLIRRLSSNSDPNTEQQDAHSA